jgi:hypothetical protein
VYRDRLRTLHELKTAITAYIRNISKADLQEVFANKIKRVQACIDARGHTSNTFCKCTANFRTQICRKCLRIKLNGFGPVSTLVDITSNTFCKCTANFRTQICRKCLLIRLNGLRLYRRSWTSLPTPFVIAHRHSERRSAESVCE